MNEALRAELLAMDEHDQAVRAELAADGSLFEGYHPRMAAVHDSNAARLSEITREHGWPTTALVGHDGAKAAHRIAQHSINHPEFMRECRRLIKVASDHGEIPRDQFAYIDDRIRVYEGLPQLYGTQWRDSVNGLEPYPVDDWKLVNQRRRDLELPILEEMRPEWGEPLSQEAVDRKRADELAWRRKVGWIMTDLKNGQNDFVKADSTVPATVGESRADEMPVVTTTAKKPRVTSFAPQFLVDNLERSIEYYAKLGFTFGEPWDDFYAIGYLDGFELHLKEAPKNEDERRHRRDNEHLDAAAGVNGIEVFFRQCVANGVTILKPLTPTAWGTKDFYVEDPDGYIICFGGRPIERE